ncbi:hypothetical protein NSK_005676 [Nannochloropsis salina CCMP1776]|uniref:UBX domain-containing protein n=1 Tax=Nannochloropsis salina CCMP1776 TaxID=1027361 RepID=A0A4D9CXV3_9STRA|nr:hypothetical protein NSK_005676 [Nannochloropsis salina CCMP1776]|eukprot:TFJ83017.1 hypothetical protein NSK_005676 [Nannochloropsis salina CCMP1776]
MLEEEETRALAQEREADEQRLQLETEMDAEGIRRPRDRKLSFTPASAFLSSSHVRERPDGKSCAEIKARKNIELMATGGVAVAEEEGELAIDRHMLRKAYEVRRARVESLSRFQSKRKRHGRQSGQTRVSFVRVRVKFPDGAALTARFCEEEKVEDIFRVLNRVLPPSCQSSSLPSSFHLLSLGGKGPRRLLPSTDVTLRAAGLMGPTASLLFRWEKGEGQLLPKATAEWMDPALFPATGDGAGVHECGDG